MLTATAERHATRHSLGAAIAAAPLGPDCRQGDVVSVLQDGERHDFVVLRRSWVIDAGAAHLELVLDHPAR